jgi:hypothetical protein
MCVYDFVRKIKKNKKIKKQKNNKKELQLIYFTIVNIKLGF